MHENYMRQAIREAKKGRGYTHTNPLVGSVIVQDGQVIGSGAHLRYGEAHAEKNALASCQTPEKLFNATLYVTLEPCHHFGKQPPCTQALVDAGIKTVVIGQLDPNPLVAGKGKAFLEEQGIEVITGILEEQVRALNPYYNFFYEHGRPYVVLKQAVSLDGKLALKDRRTTITGEQSYDRVHTERANFQALVIGSSTAIIDNPSLLAEGKNAYPPIRLILDRKGEVFNHKDLKLFHDASAPVWIVTEREKDDLPKHVKLLHPAGFEIEDILSLLAQENIQSLYVEGGAQIHDSFLDSDLWDEIITYMAPILIGGDGLPAFSSKRHSELVRELGTSEIELLGRDLRISNKRR